MSDFRIKYILFAALVFVSVQSSAQNGYYVTDSVYTNTQQIKDMGDVANAEACHLLRSGEIIRMSPYEVEEYGLPDGRRYISKEIKTGGERKRVFLELLETGDVDLYYYRASGIKTFFIETGEKHLKELPRKSPQTGNIYYKDYLKYLTTDYTPLSEQSHRINYTGISLEYFIQAYNQRKIVELPYRRYGLKAHVNFTRHIVNILTYGMELEDIDLTYNSGFGFGVFTDIPVYSDKISLVLEAGFSGGEYIYYGSDENTEYVFTCDVASLDVPVTLRYSLGGEKVRTHLNAGSIVSFNVRDRLYMYKANISPGLIEIDKIKDNDYLPGREIGLSLGAGIKVPLKDKMDILIEGSSNFIVPLLEEAGLSRTAFQLTLGLIL
ncbi:MAG: outer membrane beta-barrel protein [Bacteroidales bacterium]